MEKLGYLWESRNGCARCQALAGYYDADELPARPHPHCQCDILAGERLRQRVHACFYYEIVDARWVETVDENTPGSRGWLAYDYHLKCVSGEEHAGSVDISMVSDDFYDFDTNTNIFMEGYVKLIGRAMTKIDAIAKARCCGPDVGV